MSAPEIAILGGSFDPPHIGHVMLALFALSVGGVEQVLVVPTYQHAFGKPLLDFEHRMRMCELGFSVLRNVQVSPLERELGGESRTLRLVRELKARHPAHGLRLLIGEDILHQRDRWQSFDEICALAPPLVAGRSGFEHPDAPEGPILPAVSSSEVRRLLLSGLPTSSFIPRAVSEYIEHHQLYRDAT